MAKRCGSRSNPCTHPRSRWWKNAMGIDWLSSGGDSFTPNTEYQDVLDVATTGGYQKPTAGRQVKDSGLIDDIKGIDRWNPIRTMKVYCTDGDSDFGTIDWKTPLSFQAAKVNSPTHTANIGLLGNGTTSYVNHNVNLATEGGGIYTQEDACVIQVIYNPPNSSTQICGSRQSSTIRTQMMPANGSGLFAGMINNGTAGTSLAFTKSSTFNYYYLRRVAGGDMTQYANGQTNTANLASVAIPDVDYFDLALDNAGVASSFMASTVVISITGASSIVDIIPLLEAYINSL